MAFVMYIFIEPINLINFANFTKINRNIFVAIMGRN